MADAVRRRITGPSTINMLGRSNSLSLNTNAVNSSLYVPSSSTPSNATFPSHSTKDPSTNRGDDKLPSQPAEKKRDSAQDARAVSNADAPWMDPNWKPPPPPTVHLDAGAEWRQDSKKPRTFFVEIRKVSRSRSEKAINTTQCSAAEPEPRSEPKRRKQSVWWRPAGPAADARGWPFRWHPDPNIPTSPGGWHVRR